jgi:hypothetical protein
MNDFDQVLDDSLKQIASGTATIDDCLARYPEYSGELKPLLRTASRLGQGRELMAPDGYKKQSREQLMAYMQAHPRRNIWKLPMVWSVAISLAVLALFFIVTGTALAQSALPGQPLYEWKLSSENFWRSSSPDRVGVDLELADRRTNELTSVSGNSTNEAKALAGYKEVLTRLKTENDEKNNDRILHTLKSNQQKLSAAGIDIPELNSHISP